MSATPRFFIPQEQFQGDTATVCGADHLHLARVLRAKPGDAVELLDNLGGAFAGCVVSVERNQTQIRIGGNLPTRLEPATSIIVAQALGKADKFEQVVQHGTEVGASQFVPVLADRCVVNVRSCSENDRITVRLDRWNQIAREAAQQCGRCRIPVVTPPIRSIDLFNRTEDAAHSDCGPNLRLLMHPNTRAASLRTVLGEVKVRLGSVTIAIGPEGGWTPSEVSAAQFSGWREVAVGPYILRTETAAIVAISRIMYGLEY